MTPQPNSRDHPEVIEWMKKHSDAVRTYTGLNRDDPSNFLDERHKEELVKQLYEDIIYTDQMLRKWCEHYGISIGRLKFN